MISQKMEYTYNILETSGNEKHLEKRNHIVPINVVQSIQFWLTKFAKNSSKQKKK